MYKRQIQDTVVFFGSARFQGGDAAKSNLSAMEKNAANSPEHQDSLKRARAAVDMARYYEDARQMCIRDRAWPIVTS